MSQDIYAEMAVKIIQSQEAIIGPVAAEQANKVKEFHVDWKDHEVHISGNPTMAIDHLVDQYKELFGQISVDVSKDAVASLVNQLPSDAIPKSFK